MKRNSGKKIKDNKISSVFMKEIALKKNINLLCNNSNKEKIKRAIII